MIGRLVGAMFGMGDVLGQQCQQTAFYQMMATQRQQWLPLSPPVLSTRGLPRSLAEFTDMAADLLTSPSALWEEGPISTASLNRMWR